MKSVILTRQPSTPEGTFGRITYGGHAAHTLELPWHDKNGDGIGDPQKSCITPGVYILKWHESPSRGWVYEVTNVKGRSHILVHSANLAGDTDAGWVSELLGCISLGQHVGVMSEYKGQSIKPQKCITVSRTACKQFFEWGAMEPIELTITSAP